MHFSSNSIIHLTPSLKNLLSILDNGIHTQYCRERLFSIKRKKSLDFAFPMISFSDIPFSKLKEQLDAYGDYGIGMSKKWARKNGFNPVLYIDHSSNLLENIITFYDKRIHDFQNYADMYVMALTFFSYCKNYESDLIRKERPIIKNYRFSDEREWRYIPMIEEMMKISMPPFVSYEQLDEFKSSYMKLGKKISLNFQATDINYLIVKNVKDKEKLLKHLHSSSYSKKELTFKIITREQILNDF